MLVIDDNCTIMVMNVIYSFIIDSTDTNCHNYSDSHDFRLTAALRAFLSRFCEILGVFVVIN